MHFVELVFHSAVVAAALVAFAWRGYSFSWQFESGQTWDGYAPGLRPGFMGRRVDLSDIQWRDFRAGLPALATLFLISAGMSSLLRRCAAGATSRACMSLVFSVGFLSILHGTCVLFVLALLLVSFALAQTVAGRRHGAVVLWAGNLCLLLAARLGNGFSFAAIAAFLAPLDTFRGVMRWEICFNLSILRMLSYSLDLHWHRVHQGTGSVRLGLQPAKSTCKGRMPNVPPARSSFHEQDAGILAYLAYVLYAPLYLAGPIIAFYDFAAQQRQGQTPRAGEIARYAARFLADWACMELLTHCLYFNSVAKHQIGLRYQQHGLVYGTTEAALTAFWVLCFMWLKFATIWRFFRLAALLDGISPPENMQRCFANNHDLEGFWRGWHSSFNRWLVRYMYIPLGGARRRALVIWPIFFFVAMWHDLEWRLLSWAWLICLAFLPEMAAKQLARAQWMNPWRNTSVYRHVCAVAAALNIICLLTVNLVGFVLGWSGIQGLLMSVARDWKFVSAAFLVLWSAAHLQFFIQESR